MIDSVAFSTSNLFVDTTSNLPDKPTATQWGTDPREVHKDLNTPWYSKLWSDVKGTFSVIGSGAMDFFHFVKVVFYGLIAVAILYFIAYIVREYIEIKQGVN